MAYKFRFDDINKNVIWNISKANKSLKIEFNTHRTRVICELDSGIDCQNDVKHSAKKGQRKMKLTGENVQMYHCTSWKCYSAHLQSLTHNFSNYRQHTHFSYFEKRLSVILSAIVECEFNFHVALTNALLYDTLSLYLSLALFRLPSCPLPQLFMAASTNRIRGLLGLWFLWPFFTYRFSKWVFPYLFYVI